MHDAVSSNTRISALLELSEFLSLCGPKLFICLGANREVNSLLQTPGSLQGQAFVLAGSNASLDQSHEQLCLFELIQFASRRLVELIGTIQLKQLVGSLDGCL
ncbi:hypothetical protein [Neorhodopirellula pilleata]|uniref:Uncharacterized protein n=1 Tax=Neorhodopirellula pilleata TaxID=2714738 RepID=A0A5C6ACP5_9BACT|nr:hypothetical protein [Neorhodopirellula pilleata]TWT97167.1 hypothetical protein Pla100_23160 [Neorhodopirellula pilleata]